MSLAAVWTGRVPVSWPEAVALVQQISQSAIAFQIFELDTSTIVMGPSGDVEVRDGTRGDPERGVQLIGELLRGCLASTPHPVPLQMLVAQATCTPPFYRSVSELNDALSFYASPDSRELLRGVYTRCRIADPSPAEIRLRHAMSVAATVGRACHRMLLRASQTAPARIRQLVSSLAVRPKWVTRRLVILTAGVLLAVGAAGLAFAAGLGRSAGPAIAAGISRANSEATLALTSTVHGAVDLIRSRLARTPAAAARNSKNQPVPKRTRVRAVDSSGGPPRPRDARGIPAPAGNTEHPGTPVATTHASAPVPATASAHDAATSNRPTLDPSRVYSADDPEVAPPVVAENVQRRESLPGERQRDGTAVTVVVDENGRVLSAALLHRPATFQESMAATLNLSAVKTWRFEPATHTGRPVKYRMTVWVATP